MKIFCLFSSSFVTVTMRCSKIPFLFFFLLPSVKDDLGFSTTFSPYYPLTKLFRHHGQRGQYRLKLGCYVKTAQDRFAKIVHSHVSHGTKALIKLLTKSTGDRSPITFQSFLPWRNFSMCKNVVRTFVLMVEFGGGW